MVGLGPVPEMGRTQAAGRLSQPNRCLLWLLGRLLGRLLLLVSATASATATESATAASAGPIARADGGDAVRGLVLFCYLRLDGRQVLGGGVDCHLVSTDGQTAEAVAVVEEVEADGRRKPPEEGIAEPGRFLIALGAES